MHKKLSEIAEIPRILSSTLETVSQTFEKFVPPIDTFSDCDVADDDDLEIDENLKDNDAILQQKNELNFKYHFQPIIDDTNSGSEKESGTQDDLSNPDFEDIIHETDIINNHDEDDDDEDEFFEADSLDGDLQRKDILNVPDSPESDYISEEDEEEAEQYSSPISGIVGKTTPTSILMNFNQLVNNCMPELKTEEEQAEDDAGDEEEDVASNSHKLSLKTIDDPVKTEKFEKVKLLERTWPWADRQKIIYRESTCHLVPRLSIVETRIKQLGGISTLPFHDRNRKDLNKSVDE